MSRWRSDRGSGSVLTLAAACVVVVLAAALGLLAQAAQVRARAQSVADLSALSAAREAQRAAFGDPDAVEPCGRAGAVATHNGGRVAACTLLAAGRVRIEAVVAAPVGEAEASALAGPSP